MSRPANGSPVSRRRFLAGVVGGSATVAGCLGGGETTVRSVEESFTIEHRDWASIEFSLPKHGRVTYEGTVSKGPAVDFVLMHSVEYENYADGDGFGIVEFASRLDTTSASVDEKIPAGEFVFVVDHTNRIEAKVPRYVEDKTVTVDVTLETYKG